MKTVFIRTEEVAKKSVSFYFKKPANYTYIAGQFIELYLPHTSVDERGEKRWFTLSSAPDEEKLTITTKQSSKPSSFKYTLFNLSPGDEVSISQPMGDFVLPKSTHKPLLFVAGGIGSTPFRSMCASLKSNDSRNITMIYAAKDIDHMAFKQLFDRTTNLQLVIGKLEADTIKQAAANMKQPLIYISGPEPLVEDLYLGLINSYPASQLLVDYFHNYT